MSHAIMVPVTGQGTVMDHGLATYLPQLVRPPFSFKDVFFYSHGWWTTAQAAMIDYSRFSVGMLGQIMQLAAAGGIQAPAHALEVGIHWPAMISEDSEAIIDVLQPLTFYNRAAMADDVGEHAGAAILQLIVQAMQAGESLNFHLIGHSFGCRVIASALTKLAAGLPPGSLDSHNVNLVLLQGALDSDAFEPNQIYGNLLSTNRVPNLRLLITHSDQDTAVGKQYPRAYELIHLFGKRTTGIGATGLSPGTPGACNAVPVSVGPGFTSGGPPVLRANRMIVADLTPLHSDGRVQGDGFSGHHSDIYREEIYRLICGFLFGV